MRAGWFVVAHIVARLVAQATGTESIVTEPFFPGNV